MNNMVDKLAGDDTGTATDGAIPKSYKVFKDNKVAVSKTVGPIWKARIKQAQNKRDSSGVKEAWETAVRYFENDQLPHRQDGSDGSHMGNGIADRINLDFAETENIIFANATAAVPYLYANNPTVEITPPSPEMRENATLYERLVNILFTKKYVPGVNLVPKGRRAVLSAFLCNIGWIETGWIYRDQDIEGASLDMASLLKQYETAKKGSEIKDIEGKLALLEKKAALFEEPGPFVKYHRPTDVLRDPDSIEEDLSDARWIAIKGFEPTNEVRAKYFKEGEDETLYEPTHRVAMAGRPDKSGTTHDEIDDLVNNFSLFDKGDSWKELGYDDEESYKDSMITQLWYIWDKTTRRMLTFHSKSWQFPLWVEPDPYNLPGFFPVTALWFYNSVNGGESKGETTYILDQQDAINWYNSLKHQVASFAASKFVYDKNRANPDDVKKMLHSSKLNVLGINVPDGATLENSMPMGVKHPGMDALQVIDKREKLEAIDRISSVSDVLRGGQFKTNTTNKAIDEYNSQSRNRFDDLTSAVETFIGDIGEKVMFLCMLNMDATQVSALLGPEEAQGWRNLSKEEAQRYSLRVVGGSTQKPTSEAKRKEAMEIAQILGQFASATPVAALIAVRVMERAFDGMTISDEDWDLLAQSIAASIGLEQDPTDTSAQGEGDEEQSPVPNDLNSVYNDLSAPTGGTDEPTQLAN